MPRLSPDKNPVPTALSCQTPRETMRLLKRSNAGELGLTKYFVNDDEIPPYAILSHTWMAGEEVVYEELKDGAGKG